MNTVDEAESSGNNRIHKQGNELCFISKEQKLHFNSFHYCFGGNSGVQNPPISALTLVQSQPMCVSKFINSILNRAPNSSKQMVFLNEYRRIQLPSNNEIFYLQCDSEGQFAYTLVIANKLNHIYSPNLPNLTIFMPNARKLTHLHLRLLLVRLRALWLRTNKKVIH